EALPRLDAEERFVVPVEGVLAGEFAGDALHGSSPSRGFRLPPPPGAVSSLGRKTPAAKRKPGVPMRPPILTTEELRRSTARLPRVDLAHLPTPLEEVPRFAEVLDGPRV